ncbi:MAG: hypothetical protein JSW50_16815 [Candidatus Latescibacterota bacterium]|nr:MAG: hypothetical protein JSW50_16815 [Candidatus Latescibacterota bacterium]
MRYVISGEWNRNQLLRLILFFFLVYMLLFWITNWILYFQKMSLDPNSVVTYFRGDPAAEFGQPPRPLGAIAEVSHFHLFAMGMLVMTLTHLLLFLPVSFRVKGSLTLITFLAALLNQGSNWLVRFVHPDFAWLKVLSFLTLQIALFGLLIALIAGVLRPRRNTYADHDRRPHSTVNGWNPS